MAVSEALFVQSPDFPAAGAPERQVRLNNDTGLLKLLACAFMMCDHMGKMVFPHAYKLTSQGQWWSFLLPESNILRVVGRLAMPLFAYCAAVGSLKTRSNVRYVLRLLLMGILVQPLYQEAMGHVSIGAFDWLHNFWRLDLIYTHYYCANLNIFFTLTLGTLLTGLCRHRHYLFMVLTAILVWTLRSHLDYGYRGVVLIALFYLFIDNPLASFFAVFAYMLNWAMPYLFSNFRTVSNSQLYAIVSLILIYLPVKKRRVKLKKWFYYSFYPAHLIIIYLLIAYDRSIWPQLAARMIDIIRRFI